MTLAVKLPETIDLKNTLKFLRNVSKQASLRSVIA